MSQPKIAENVTRWITRQARKRVPYGTSNPFLEGPYAPVGEEVTLDGLRVEGTLPPTLDGMYLRIGPNPVEVANPAGYHWFTGDGMVHGLRLGGGHAQWYRNRWVGSDSVRRRQGRAVAPGPRHGLFDTVNTNIVGHAGRLWALVEAGPVPVQLDPSLDTVRHGLFDSSLRGSYSAHPHRDPDSGELHAICYEGGNTRSVRHVVVDSGGDVTRNLHIPVDHGPMIHDCAITSKYVLVLDLPVTFSVGEVLQGSSLPYKWNDSHTARVGLLPRDGEARDIRWCTVEPCYVFHACNAYDLDDGRVIVDVVVHGRMFDRSRQGPEAQRVTFERWTCDPVAGRVAREVVCEHKQEFPRLDERLTGKSYRYAYAVGADLGEVSAQPLYRHDLLEGTTTVHDFGPGQLPGEVVFVPASADSAEDEGWLMGFVTDLATQKSALVVLDAQQLGRKPQAVVNLPVRVPLGFHGNFVAAGDLDR